MGGFDYSFEKMSHTLQNALCNGHCNEGGQIGRMGHHVIYALLAGAVIIPIMIKIVKDIKFIVCFSPPSHPTSFSSRKAFSVLTRQKHPKTNRQTCIHKNKPNLPVPLSSLPKRVQYVSENATVYRYNAEEGIQDNRWECALRAIQTCLSTYDIACPSLESLFTRFRSLNLRWGGAFIGKKVLDSYEIPSCLETVNGLSEISLSLQTSHSVFQQPSLTFQAFRDRLIEHFKAEDAAPVMIDDGLYSFNIIGIGLQETNTILWIADPHIEAGVNSTSRKKLPLGLYTIALDLLGKQIGCSLADEDWAQVFDLYLDGVLAHRLHFDQTCWTVLFPI